MISSEYKVNKYISLKLVEGQTDIYIGGKRFRQCRHILLINPHKREEQWEIKSIDDIIEKFSTPMEQNFELSEFGITPEQEFWAHCSNIETWVENNYNSRLLDKYLAFPILKLLSELGDKKAEVTLKEEIIQRLKTDSNNILLFFLQEGYFSLLTENDLFDYLLDPNESETMKLISKFSPYNYTLTININESLRAPEYRTLNKLHMYIEKGHVIELELSLKKHTHLEQISRLPFLRKLYAFDFEQTKHINLIKSLKKDGFKINYKGSNQFIAKKN